MDAEHRTINGQFAPGNPGGPGRPRRAVEREYMGIVADACTLDDWREIVGRAVEDAKAGDAAARVWLAKLVLGDKLRRLIELAAGDYLGRDADADIELEAKCINRTARLLHSLE